MRTRSIHGHSFDRNHYDTSSQRLTPSYSAEDSMVFVKFSPGFPRRCHGLHLARTFGAVRRRQTPVARLARLLAK